MSPRHLLHCAAALALAACITPSAQAAAIAIDTPSFEADALAEDANTNNFVTGWSSTIGTSGCAPQCFGVYNPGVGVPNFPSGTAPDGNNVVYLTSPSDRPVFQTLNGTVLAANTRYTLTVLAGNPADRPDNAIFGFRLGVEGSSNTYAELSGPMTIVGNGHFVELSSSITILAGNPDIGKTLRVELLGPRFPGVGQPYVVFDNVRLDAAPVPEPASALLFAPGLGLLAWLARRRLNA